MIRNLKFLSLIMALLFVLLSFAACGSAAKSEAYYESTSSTAAGYASDSYYDKMDFTADETYPEESVEMESPSSAEADASIERQIIKTANLTLETQNFDDTIANIKASVLKYGGYISSSSVNGSKTEGTRYSSLTCRVPASEYNEFLSGTGDFGNVTYLSENEEDVTNEYIDLDARINNLEAQLKKLEELLEKAETLEDMLTIQGYISDIQYQLDSYKGRMKALTNQISYCTVRITVDEVGVYTAPKNSFLSRLGSAFSGMWGNFINFLQELLIFIIYALPYLIIIAGIVILVKFLNKKRRAKKALQKENKADINQEQNL